MRNQRPKQEPRPRPPLLVRCVFEKILALAVESDRKFADLFVEWHAHVNLLTVRGYIGGWHHGQPCDFQAEWRADDHSTPGQMARAAEKLLGAVVDFVATAPARATALAQEHDRIADQEIKAFGEAVRDYALQLRRSASAEDLNLSRLKIDEQLASMKHGARNGLWWDAAHGTWGIGELSEEDIEATKHGAIIAGPHHL